MMNSVTGTALLDSIRTGPRGPSTNIRGPFAVFLHAPAFGELAQKLGGYCRFNTSVSPRLSEFAILATAKLWRAQYEWYAHAPLAQKGGLADEVIEGIRVGKKPVNMKPDEAVLYDICTELHDRKRVSDAVAGSR